MNLRRELDRLVEADGLDRSVDDRYRRIIDEFAATADDETLTKLQAAVDLARGKSPPSSS
jgi:hypothetical protein